MKAKCIKPLCVDSNRSAREIRQRMEADKPKLIEGLQRIQRAFELAKKRRKV